MDDYRSFSYDNSLSFYNNGRRCTCRTCKNYPCPTNESPCKECLPGLGRGFFLSRASKYDEGVAVFCQEDSLAEELFEVLRQNGIGKHWNAGILGNRVYCVSGNDLKWGGKSSVESTSPYSRYTKCTFYGKDEPTFEPANDSEMRGFLGF